MFRVSFVSFFSMVLFFSLLMNCKTQMTPKKSELEFPSMMKEEVKLEFRRQCEKGEVLYAITCAKCHNVEVKRKMAIPDFSLEKLLGYDIRMENKEHSNNLTGTQVTTEELGYIISFLTYKKKNGIANAMK